MVSLVRLNSGLIVPSRDGAVDDDDDVWNVVFFYDFGPFRYLLAFASIMTFQSCVDMLLNSEQLSSILIP